MGRAKEKGGKRGKRTFGSDKGLMSRKSVKATKEKDHQGVHKTVGNCLKGKKNEKPSRGRGEMIKG